MLPDYSWLCLPTVSLHLYSSSTFREPILPSPVCPLAFFYSVILFNLSPHLLSFSLFSVQPCSFPLPPSTSPLPFLCFSLSSPQTTRSFASDISPVQQRATCPHTFPLCLSYSVMCDLSLSFSPLTPSFFPILPSFSLWIFHDLVAQCWGEEPSSV